MFRRLPLLSALTAGVVGFAGAVSAAVGPLTLVSATNPFAACSTSDPGTNYVNAEVEPFVAVTHDGGASWTPSWAHFSFCSGGTAANGGDFQRASDPWVTFAPNGDAYFISLSVSFFTDQPDSGILVSKFPSGGTGWSDPITLTRDRSDVAPFLFNDKESITADPFDSNFVYAVWDRARFPSDQAGFNAQHSFSFRGDIIFSRTTNGGTSWEPARAILAPKSSQFAIGNIISVLPDGTLVDIFDNEHGSGNNFPGFDIEVIRSSDQGETWSDR